MFELPEFVTLAKQMNETLMGKTIKRGMLGNTPHKFVWYNRTHDEFERLTKGKKIEEARVKGKWLFLPLHAEYVLLIGECREKILYQQRNQMRQQERFNSGVQAQSATICLRQTNAT